LLDILKWLRVVGSVVRGVAEIDSKVFVVFNESSNVEVYDALTFNHLSVIELQELRKPRDIVACRLDNQLYVSDEDYHIWRVSTDDHKYDKWLTPESTPDTFDIYTLSLTSRRLLIVVEPRSLRQYSTVDKRLLLDIQLPQYVTELYHGVETASGTFVVSHQGTTSNSRSTSPSSTTVWRRRVARLSSLIRARQWTRNSTR